VHAFSYVSSKIGPASRACFFLYSGESGLSSGRVPGCPVGGAPALTVALRLSASGADIPLGLPGDVALPLGTRVETLTLGEWPFGVS
jgi:hypothetical protein